jgi:hypothetical protein
MLRIRAYRIRVTIAPKPAATTYAVGAGYSPCSQNPSSASTVSLHASLSDRHARARVTMFRYTSVVYVAVASGVRTSCEDYSSSSAMKCARCSYSLTSQSLRIAFN